ncbi:MAG: hypothetical protein ACUVXF_07965, partial [Desulfobaccales bacterium]
VGEGAGGHCPLTPSPQSYFQQPQIMKHVPQVADFFFGLHLSGVNLCQKLLDEAFWLANYLR